MKYFLGIDTSNYMTSVSIINSDREIIYDERKLLEVKKGEKGLQQSNAVFQHIKNLPILFKNIGTKYPISAIGVSKSPRPKKDSYMPVFMAGLSIAESMSSLYGIPIYYTTHQEGHIAAGLYSSIKKPINNDFLAVHLSGGTSEILYVKKQNSGFIIKEIGGTLDIHAGQLIDRIGVIFDFQFPAGKYIEQLALKSSKDFDRIPSSVRGYNFHFSGAETEAKRRINRGESKEEIARAIEHVIAQTLEKIIKKALESGLPKEVLIVGGVAQNQYIREYLHNKLQIPKLEAKIYFANKLYSGDNAFGVANIAKDAFDKNNS